MPMIPRPIALGATQAAAVPDYAMAAAMDARAKLERDKLAWQRGSDIGKGVFDIYTGYGKATGHYPGLDWIANKLGHGEGATGATQIPGTGVGATPPPDWGPGPSDLPPRIPAHKIGPIPENAVGGSTPPPQWGPGPANLPPRIPADKIGPNPLAENPVSAVLRNGPKTTVVGTLNDAGTGYIDAADKAKTAVDAADKAKTAVDVADKAKTAVDVADKVKTGADLATKAMGGNPITAGISGAANIAQGRYDKAAADVLLAATPAMGPAGLPVAAAAMLYKIFG